jgi:hypothetical protein
VQIHLICTVREGHSLSCRTYRVGVACMVKFASHPEKRRATPTANAIVVTVAVVVVVRYIGTRRQAPATPIATQKCTPVRWAAPGMHFIYKTYVQERAHYM